MSAQPYISALTARGRTRLGPSIAAAVALHAGVAAAAFWLPGLLDRQPPRRKPVIARLVAQGKPRPKHLLPRKPQPEEAAGAPALTLPGTSRKSPPRKKAPRQPTRQELMRRALARVTGEVSREPRPPVEREGQADGSPQGTAPSAEVGEKYFTEVHDAILANYVVPSVISERERLFLKATLLAFIGPDGSLLSHQIAKPSGNTLFDQALELAVKKTKLPAPPPELAKALRNDGVELNFKP